MDFKNILRKIRLNSFDSYQFKDNEKLLCDFIKNNILYLEKISLSNHPNLFFYFNKKHELIFTYSKKQKIIYFDETFLKEMPFNIKIDDLKYFISDYYKLIIFIYNFPFHVEFECFDIDYSLVKEYYCKICKTL